MLFVSSEFTIPLLDGFHRLDLLQGLEADIAVRLSAGDVVHSSTQLTYFL
jgi:hypothetical protein